MCVCASGATRPSWGLSAVNAHCTCVTVGTARCCWCYPLAARNKTRPSNNNLHTLRKPTIRKRARPHSEREREKERWEITWEIKIKPPAKHSRHTHTHGAALINANLVAQIIEKKTEGLHRRWDSKVSNKKIKGGWGTKQTRVYKYKRIVREMNINTKDGRLKFQKKKKKEKNGGPFKLFMYEFGCVCVAPRQVY